MKFGTIEIVNEGMRAEPSWSVTSETQGFLTDDESLDAIVNGFIAPQMTAIRTTLSFWISGRTSRPGSQFSQTCGAKTWKIQLYC